MPASAKSSRKERRVRFGLSERGGRILVGAAFLAWLCLVAVLVRNHEPWRDEADSWLLTRDASIPEILGIAHHAGTPVLWYAILLPLARAGLPFTAQALVHLVLAGAAVLLLLTRAPFAVPVRVLLAFGYSLSFEYAVISRNYALVVLALFLLAARVARATWVDGIVLALLANSSAHGFLLAGVLLVVWFGRLPVISRLVAVAGLALALAQLWPTPGGQLPPFGLTPNLERFSVLFPEAFFLDGRHAWAVLAGNALAAVAVLRLSGRPRSLLLLLGGWGALIGLFVFVYFGGFHHAGLLAVWLLFVLWVDAAEGKSPASSPLPLRLAFGTLALASLFFGVYAEIRIARFQLLHHFSDGREMADFLRGHGLDRRPIAAHPAPESESVLVGLPKRTFWYPGIGEDGSYMKWDAAYALGKELSPLDALSRVRARFPPDELPLLLLNAPLPRGAAPEYRLLHVTSGDIFAHREERYFLYEPLLHIGN